MKYWKGYGRYLRSKNPKMPLRSGEFDPVREDFDAYLESIEAEIHENEAAVLKIAGPTPSMGMLVFIVVAQVVVIALSLITAILTRSPLTQGTSIAVIALTIWGMFYQIGRYTRSKERGTDNLETALEMTRRYYRFHRPLLEKADNYDEYLQYLRMSNEADFRQTLVPEKS